MNGVLIKKIIARVFIWSVLFLMYLPIFLLVVFSFSESTAISFSDFRFGFGLYAKMFENEEMFAAATNTIVIAAISSFIATIMGTVACMGIMAMKRRTRSAVMSLNQVPIVNADIVTAFAVMLFFVAIGITNAGWFKLILVHTLISVPFVVLAVLPRFRQLDANLFEAGQDLGASPLRSLFTVVIPQLIPAMISGFFLAFTLSLDDFVVTLYNNDGVQTISTYVYGFVKKEPPAELRALSASIFFIALIGLLIYNWHAAKKGKVKGRNQ